METQNISRILHVASFAGQIILENGGATSRTEEVICIICKEFGMAEAESYVTPTGIHISVTDHQNNTVSIIKRIKERTINLEKIAMVNRLSREIRNNSINIEIFEEKLRQISSYPSHKFVVRLIAAGVVSSFFSLFFGGTKLDFICAFFVGMCLVVLLTFCKKLNVTEFLVNAAGGFLSAFLAYVAFYFNPKLHTDAIIIGGIMLLLPGLTMINAIKETIEGDFVAGLARTMEALIVAVSIALGTGLMLKIVLLFNVVFGKGVL